MNDFTQKVQECIEVAIRMFSLPISLEDVKISNYEKDLDAGFAEMRTVNGKRIYSIRFNQYHIDHFESIMIEQIIPHEVAHIVCFFDPSTMSKHNYKWVLVCYMLGGNGSRTHDMPAIRARA